MTTGWLCPACHKGNAPHAERCGHCADGLVSQYEVVIDRLWEIDARYYEVSPPSGVAYLTQKDYKADIAAGHKFTAKITQ